ncbi:hypothetical protein B0H66DRAFT_610825 [Apodospora peruviana]|uniref:Uncharacterized protein n=1 Tax=Apodospora peruviana TaxID=516989 RepID=A0AAE0IR44_9PEZI|nr:hypothetical protein B0H66DRAFT_610825 [Apodospora peruviana]
MCPACERILHSRFVLIREWEHRWMHERGACGCDVIFPGLLHRPRVIKSVGNSVVGNQSTQDGYNNLTARGRKEKQRRDRAHQQSNTYTHAGPSYQGTSGSNDKEKAAKVTEIPAAYKETETGIDVRLPGLYAAEWVPDHRTLHASGRCHCKSDFKFFRREIDENDMTEEEKEMLRGCRSIEPKHEILDRDEIAAHMAEIGNIFGTFSSLPTSSPPPLPAMNPSPGNMSEVIMSDAPPFLHHGYYYQQPMEEMAQDQPEQPFAASQFLQAQIGQSSSENQKSPRRETVVVGLSGAGRQKVQRQHEELPACQASNNPTDTEAVVFMTGTNTWTPTPQDQQYQPAQTPANPFSYLTAPEGVAETAATTATAGACTMTRVPFFSSATPSSYVPAPEQTMSTTTYYPDQGAIVTTGPGGGPLPATGTTTPTPSLVYGVSGPFTTDPPNYNLPSSPEAICGLPAGAGPEGLDAHVPNWDNCRLRRPVPKRRSSFS